MNNANTRRSFLGRAALAGGAALGTGAVKARPATKRPSTDLLRVGMMCLGPNSHYYIWGPTINPVDRKAWSVGRTTGMQITHCWDTRPENAAAFAAQYGCEAVKTYDGMVGKVDAMIFAGFNEVKWWPQLARPYLEAGIPCFLNRPFAYSMKDAKEIVETARKHNTPILCTDEREYLQQTTVARLKVEELLRGKQRILGAHSDNAAGEYPQHGIHGLYFLLAVFGLDVERVSFQADGWWREKTPTSPGKMNWAQLSLQYRGLRADGAGEQAEPFLVSQYQFGARADINLRIYHSGGWWDIAHPATGGERFNRVYYLFFPTVLAMQRMFETREMPWSYDYILRKTQIFLAGFKSHLEHDGAMVRVNDLPDDWEAPCPYPDYVDERIFG